LTIIIFAPAYPDAKKNQKNSLINGKDAVILCFHDINGAGRYSITEEEFESILKLLNNKYEVFSLKQWFEKANSNTSFSKKPVVLTFDDGYESVFKIVVPLLKKYSFGATFFIYLDRYNDNSSAYKEISALPDNFEIGSHSFSHADMESLYKNNSQLFFKEIFLSRKKLSFLTGKEIVSWAWPFGYYNKDMERMAKYAGYEIQVNTDYKTTNNQWNISSFSRFTVQNPDPVDQVKEILRKTAGK
jgi:peptidoglycan/xylan/chitin deacetylase (PgdA/CDA1 family)